MTKLQSFYKISLMSLNAQARFQFQKLDDKTFSLILHQSNFYQPEPMQKTCAENLLGRVRFDVT